MTTTYESARKCKSGLVWVAAAIAAVAIAAGAIITVNVTVIVVTAVSESQKKQAVRSADRKPLQKTRSMRWS